MAYDEELADRIREQLTGEDGVGEKKMFGGLAFLVNGHMCVAASGQGGLLARVDPAGDDDALAQPHAEAMVMRGRPMDGWIRVAPEGVASESDLRSWVERGLAYVRTLPPK
jgi:TfoX/Sxy family transcriptional regulator of competence genes